jgi:hypothetical protein
LKLELDPIGSDLSTFKVLPRFKHRAENTSAYFSDQVQLVSAVIDQHRIHASTAPVSHKNRQTLNEVNLKTGLYSWRPVLFERILPGQDKYLKADQSIRLYHPEAHCYVSAEAEPDDRLIHMPFLEPRRNTSAGRIVSCKTVWALERSDQQEGGLLTWEGSFRLRHVPSEKYLAVDPTSHTIVSNEACFEAKLVERKELGGDFFLHHLDHQATSR